MKKAIFLDFDGVLFDTIKEAFAVSMITSGRYKRISEIDFLSEFYNLFQTYRYLVSDAWNYFFLIKTIDEKMSNPDISIINKYNEFIKDAGVDDYKAFEKEFFITRGILRENSFTEWLNLNSMFLFLKKLKKIIEEKKKLFHIITTKDGGTILKLLQTEKIPFDKKNIFGRDFFSMYKRKSVIIEQIMREKDIKEAIFLDDLASHLEPCKRIKNLKTVQVCWGYNSLECEKGCEDDMIRIIEKFLDK